MFVFSGISAFPAKVGSAVIVKNSPLVIPSVSTLFEFVKVTSNSVHSRTSGISLRSNLLAQISSPSTLLTKSFALILKAVLISSKDASAYITR